ncbi:MAG TPA: hypothetical protein VMW30_01610 [Candidatus Paceibacterota bacterium]|nr:hypothetical protein [Candidatus Paceibacterota bacterium]
MGKLRRKVGFWGSVGRLKLSELFSFEFLSSALLATIATVFLVRLVNVSERVSISGDFLSISAALLGVVAASMALVVALISESYMRLLAASNSGVLGFLSPFVIAIGIQLTTVIGAVGYRAFAELVPPKLEHWLFGILCALFLDSCFEVVTLARSILMHALLRAGQLEVTDLEVQRIKKHRDSLNQ